MYQNRVRIGGKAGNLKLIESQQTLQRILTPICDHVCSFTINAYAKVRFKWRGQIKDTLEMFNLTPKNALGIVTLPAPSNE